MIARAAVHLARPGAHGAALDLSRELDESSNAAPNMDNCAETGNNCFGNTCVQDHGLFVLEHLMMLAMMMVMMFDDGDDDDDDTKVMILVMMLAGPLNTHVK